MLAGGLTPAVVEIALTLANPVGVDVASGVERPKGVKDAQLIEFFCTAVKNFQPALDQ